MKALLATLSIAAAVGFAAPALAGPNVGTRSHGQAAIERLHANREARGEARPYALTGDRAEAAERLTPTLKWIGGHRYRRVVYTQAPIE